MIPKIIHYVWVTDSPLKYPEFRVSWMKHNPDYTFYFWTLNNLPFEKMSETAREIIQDKKLFFLVKAELLKHEMLRIFGGIYVDHDMECLRSFDCFLANDCFTGVEGPDGNIGTAIIGSVKGGIQVSQYSDHIQTRYQYDYELCNRSPVRTVGPRDRTYQEIFKRATVYPMEYFYPFNCMEPEKRMLDFPKSFAKHYWNCKDEDGWMNKHKEFISDEN